MSRLGMVYIVGAGPGDPGLITVKGLACVREADIVMHDRLIDKRLLDEARFEAEIIDVGKTPGEGDGLQNYIHALMIAQARLGKTVCRLKGGDPFVFGRGGEEAQALAQAGIPFEIVPGVSSAIAVPAYAGIPLTHREHAHSFLVMTGCRSKDVDGEEWSIAQNVVTRGGTLVILMGFTRFRAIVASLLRDGCPPSIPVAVVSSGTSSSQETRFGTLDNITDRLDGLKPPAVIVVGNVVSLRQEIHWFQEAYALV